MRWATFRKGKKVFAFGFATALEPPEDVKGAAQTEANWAAKTIVDKEREILTIVNKVAAANQLNGESPFEAASTEVFVAARDSPVAYVELGVVVSWTGPLANSA